MAEGKNVDYESEKVRMVQLIETVKKDLTKNEILVDHNICVRRQNDLIIRQNDEIISLLRKIRKQLSANTDFNK